MPVNDFKAFATGAGANVVDQPTYAADPVVGGGYTSGVALSPYLNKTWRQGTFIAAVIAQFLMEELGTDSLDDGDLEGWVARLRNGFTALNPRQTLTATTTNYYVDPVSGDDDNDGTTTGTAWRTIQHAADFCVGRLDFNNKNVVVHLLSGTHAGFSQVGSPVGCFHPSQLIYRGNTTTPDSVVISESTVSACALFAEAAQAQLQGVKLTSGGTDVCGVIGVTTGNVLIESVDFGACSGAHVRASPFGSVYLNGPYTISGGANFHLQAIQGLIQLPGFPVGGGSPFVITLTGTPAFAIQFANAQNGGQIQATNALATFTGAATGDRYFVDTHGIINTNGGGTTYFPGSIAGSVDSATYGIYGV